LPESRDAVPVGRPPAARAAHDREADVVVVGGGLSGASIARQLARRNQNVVLVERGELASGASGASTGWATVHFASYMDEYPDGHMRLMAKGLDLFVEEAEALGEEIEYGRPQPPLRRGGAGRERGPRAPPERRRDRGRDSLPGGGAGARAPPRRVVRRRAA
jgi:glycine/D-amino acid oxidase-like deaminating enzyme